MNVDLAALGGFAPFDADAQNTVAVTGADLSRIDVVRQTDGAAKFANKALIDVNGFGLAVRFDVGLALTRQRQHAALDRHVNGGRVKSRRKGINLDRFRCATDVDRRELRTPKAPNVRARIGIALELTLQATEFRQQVARGVSSVHARSYEPRSINAGTTVRAIHLLMDYYRLTGETKFLAGIPAAIQYLESMELPAEEARKYGYTGNGRQGILVPRFVDPDTGKPLYVHRVGSNVANGHYYTDQNITNTIAHYSSGAFIDIASLKSAYNEIRTKPVEELIKDSPLLSTEQVPLPRFYTRIFSRGGDKGGDVMQVVRSLTKEGYWLTPLQQISNPYKECPDMEPSKETKYASTFVGDEFDTSCYTSEEPVMGISTAVYVSNMMKCIQFLESKKTK